MAGSNVSLVYIIVHVHCTMLHAVCACSDHRERALYSALYVRAVLLPQACTPALGI
jgi:hypothetical protein